MRKLGILVMALVLVVGMSSGAMADLGDGGGVEGNHAVDFTIDVGQYAQIELPDSYNLNIDNLKWQICFAVCISAALIACLSI